MRFGADVDVVWVIAIEKASDDDIGVRERAIDGDDRGDFLLVRLGRGGDDAKRGCQELAA